MNKEIVFGRKSKMAKKLRRYGNWAGNPLGTPEDPIRCIEEIFPNIGNNYQCQRKRGYGRDGLYCKQHDPDRIAKREAQKEREFEAKCEKMDEKKMRNRLLNELSTNIPTAELHKYKLVRIE